MDAMAGDTVARVRLGMITPSSNTVLEPACAAMLRAVPHVTAHFARVRVTRIGLDASAAAQFDPAPMLAAASLLADAKVQAICWNGTSASWLGLDHDEALCAAIEQQTGVPATSASLATVALLRGAKVRRFGLVSPYTPDVQRRIIDRFAALGFECVAEAHCGIADNYAFAEVAEHTVARMAREVAEARPQAISILCTNMRGFPRAAAVAAQTGIPVLDSTACALWGALRLARIDPGQIAGWGFDAGLG